jgi:hypothetical protein
VLAGWTFLRNKWRHLVQGEKRPRQLKMLPSGLLELVADEEFLARFLTSSRHFNAMRVKETAFLPPKPPKDGESSVFRHGESPRDQLWKIGREHLGEQRTLHGAAIFTARDVRNQELNVVSEEPPPRHANIMWWPGNEDRAEAKARVRERAIAIAACATLVKVDD